MIKPTPEEIIKAYSTTGADATIQGGWNRLHLLFSMRAVEENPISWLFTKMTGTAYFVMGAMGVCYLFMILRREHSQMVKKQRSWQQSSLPFSQKTRPRERSNFSNLLRNVRGYCPVFSEVRCYGRAYLSDSWVRARFGLVCRNYRSLQSCRDWNYWTGIEAISGAANGVDIQDRYSGTMT